MTTTDILDMSQRIKEDVTKTLLPKVVGMTWRDRLPEVLAKAEYEGLLEYEHIY